MHSGVPGIDVSGLEQNPASCLCSFHKNTAIARIESGLWCYIPDMFYEISSLVRALQRSQFSKKRGFVKTFKL